MKKTFLLASVLVSTLCASAMPGELSHTKRVVNGVTVDLQPLVDWQNRRDAKEKLQESERPLKGWVPISKGGFISKRMLGWIVSGEVEGERQTVLLKHPPEQELADFVALKQRYDALKARRDTLAAQAKTITQQSPPSNRRAKQLHAQQSANLKKAAADAAAELTQFNKQGYNLDQDFQIECFALKTGQVFEKMPVLDRGYILY